MRHGNTHIRRQGTRVQEIRRAPNAQRHVFEIALDVDPADRRDVDVAAANGWRVVDPEGVVSDPLRVSPVLQQSSAEFSVAQGIYVETQSGWFSDRTVRYLASGKPVLVQDTGWTRNYPSGRGLLGFRTLEEAVAARPFARCYTDHSRAARALAEESFDSRKVLSALIETAAV